MKYSWCFHICTCEQHSARHGFRDATKADSCCVIASWTVVVHAAVAVVLTSGLSVFQYMHHWSSAKQMTAAGFWRVRLSPCKG